MVYNARNARHSFCARFSSIKLYESVLSFKRILLLALSGFLFLTACLTSDENDPCRSGGCERIEAQLVDEVLMEEEFEQEILDLGVNLVPSYFDQTALGTWHGRPTMGGVWVISSQLKKPIPVFITNLENGRSEYGKGYPYVAVEGEQSMIPNVRLSSAAARAIGVRPRTPRLVRIVAVEEEAVEEPLVVVEEIDGIVLSTIPLDVKTIQIGIFRKLANSEHVSQRLIDAGVATASVRPFEMGEEELWSVTAKGDDELLSYVRSIGFTDAYFLRPIE